ncbi:MAG: hypothetical protein D6776_07845, partial [Planctomycetota bacterium]
MAVSAARAAIHDRSRDHAMADDNELQRQLRQLTEVGIALTAERDIDRLLDRILTEARRLTRAEAGTLYVREGDRLRFAVVQNERRPELARAAHAAAQLPPIPISASSLAGWVACSAT